MPELTRTQLGGLKVRSAADNNQYHSSIIYGPPGIGKTTLAASACEVEAMCPVLHLNIENGAQSIEHRYPQLEIVDIDSIKELQDVFRELHAKKGAGYKTIIPDNLTEAQSQGMDYILGSERERVDFTEFEGATFGNGAWNRSSEQMRKLIRYFRGLPMNVIFVAWAKDYAKEDNKVDMRPSFTKTFGGEAPGMVNDVYYYYKAGDDRILLTEATERAVAKDRTGKLPKLIKNPTFTTINKYWTGELTRSTPTTDSTNGSGIKGKVRTGAKR